MQSIINDKIAIGPRVRHECELRVRELKARRHPSPEDRRELIRLEEFLQSIASPRMRDGREEAR
jgi:hypothetical protein